MNDRIRTMLADRKKLIEDARQLVNKADEEKRDLTSEEQNNYDKYLADAAKIQERADHELKLWEAEKTLDDDGHPRPAPPGWDSTGRNYDAGERSFFDSDGRQVRLYRQGEQMAPDMPDAHRGVNPALRAVALATGNKHLVEEHRDMTTGLDPSGGFWLPMGAFLDLPAAKSVSMAMGARRFPMSSPEMVIARTAGRPTGAWKRENVAASSSDMSLDGIRMVAKTIMFGPVHISEEVAQDSPRSAIELLENEMSTGVALTIDEGVLRGSGQGAEPVGILNTTGVQTSSLSTSLTWDHVSQAQEAIALVNGRANGMALSVRDFFRMDRIKDAEGRYQSDPSWAVRRMASTQIPQDSGVGSDESEAFVGDWSQAWIGMRSEAKVDVSRDASDSSGSAFEKLQIRVRLWMRVAVGIVRPNHFYVYTSIL